MANEIKSDQFAATHFNDSGINMHMHESGRPTRLVVFVHGFNGSPYKTWRNFPSLVFRDSTATDVGICRYRSFMKRVGQRSVRLEDAARLIVEAIWEYENRYNEIFLVGHSLGGVLAHWAAKIYIEQSEFKSIMPLAGLVTLGAPLAGTGLAARVLSPVVTEFRVLSRFNSRAGELEEFFSSRRTESNNLGSLDEGQTLLPRFSAIGARDGVVSRMSSAVSIPARQRKRMNASHRSLPKPVGEDSEQIVWLSRVMSEVRQVRQQVRRQRRHETYVSEPSDRRLDWSPLVAEFRGSPDSVEWEMTFSQAIRDASTDVTEVVNWRFAGYNGKPTLLVAVARAQGVIDNAADDRQRTLRAYEECTTRPALTVGLAAFGDGAAAAVSVIRSWLPQPTGSASYYIEAAPTLRDLYQSISRWIALVASNLRLQRLSNPQDPLSDDWTGGGLL